ncbi:hypothetical protein [Vibrio anguillarum]|uniref:hypothetical protein n=2 Tax=Vibrio anguillarum TaxID=55601 RepID=UPI00188D72C0|nr:hypothetical protein [Vibrio anguillarum]MBF4252766.1 hypothetical protein [Vibrio anguillarum]MBF4307919.1 hypothetical protein [Vibrio anguillarum]
MEFLKAFYQNGGEQLGIETSFSLAAFALALLLIIKLRQRVSCKTYWLVVIVNIVLIPNAIVQMMQLQGFIW